VTENRRRGRTATAARSLPAVGIAIAAVIMGSALPAAALEPNRPDSGASAAFAGGVAPVFVDAAALPQGARFGSWSAGAIAAGVPARAPFCLDGVFDARRTAYRPYRANPKVGAEELISPMATESDAAALVARLRTQLEGCYQRWLDLDIPAYRNDRRTASWTQYAGSDNLALYGVFTVPPAGFDHAIHLYAVGLRGATVMVLHLVLAGDRVDAPAEAFRSSAQAALAGMY
jgi:hypothetical protein